MARKKKKRRKRKSSSPETTKTNERNSVQPVKVDTESDSFENSPESAGSNSNVSAERTAESFQSGSETKNKDAGAPSSPPDMSADESGEIIISQSTPRKGHSESPLNLLSTHTEEVIKEPRPGMPLVAPPPSSEIDKAAGAEHERDGISEEEITDRQLRLDTDALWVLQPSLRDSKKRQGYEKGNDLSSRTGEISGETKPPQTHSSPSNTALSVDFGGDGPTVLVDESYQKLATDIVEKSDSQESTTEKREGSGKEEKKLVRPVVDDEESKTEKTQDEKEQNGETKEIPSAEEEKKETKISVKEKPEKIEALPMQEEIAAHLDRDNTPLAVPLSKNRGNSSPIPGSVAIPPLPSFDKPKKATNEKVWDTQKSSPTPPRPEPKPIGEEPTPLKPKALSTENPALMESKESPKEAEEPLPPPPAPNETAGKKEPQVAHVEPLPPPAPKDAAGRKEHDVIQDEPLPPPPAPKDAAGGKEHDVIQDEPLPPPPAPKDAAGGKERDVIQDEPLPPPPAPKDAAGGKERDVIQDELLPPPPAPKDAAGRKEHDVIQDEPLPPPPAPKDAAGRKEHDVIQDEPLPPPPAPDFAGTKQKTPSPATTDEPLPPPPAPKFASPPSEPAPQPPQTAAPMNKVGTLDDAEDEIKTKSQATSEIHAVTHPHSPSASWQKPESKNKVLAKLDSSVRKVAPQKAVDDTGRVLLIHPSPFPVATDAASKEKAEQFQEDAHHHDEKQKEHKADSQQISNETSQAKEIIKEEAKRLEDLVVSKTKKQKKSEPVPLQEVKPEPKESGPFTSGVLEAKVSSGEIQAPAPRMAVPSEEESLQTPQKVTLSGTIQASAEEKTLKQKAEPKITAETSDKPIQKTERGSFRKAMADGLQLDMDAQPAPPADTGLKGEVLELKSPEDSADSMSPKNAFSELEKAFFEQDLEPEPVEDDFTDLFGEVQEPSSVWGWIKSKTTGKTENGKQEKTVKKKTSLKTPGKSKSSKNNKQTKKTKPSKSKTGGKKAAKPAKKKKKP